MPPNINIPPPRNPDPQDPQTPKPSLGQRILRWWLTDERIRGYVRHAGAWLATWLATHHLLGSDSSSADLVVGCIGNIAVLAWSWYSGAKDTLRQRIAGVARHALTIVMAVAIFKHWISQDQADNLVQVILGMIVSCGVSAAGGEKTIPRAEKVEDEDEKKSD